jgi:D-3-phosphoglycerate dehydrogenase
MSECIVIQPIAFAGLRVLGDAGISYHVAESPDLASLRPLLADARAVITRNLGFSAAMIAAAPRLRVISSHGTGVDAIDSAAAQARGIAIFNTAGSNAQAVAEHTIALMFACAKHVCAGDCAVRSDRFDMRYELRSMELAGRTIGLVGFGHIARIVARLASALGMRVLVWSRRDLTAELLHLPGVRQEKLESLLPQADVVSLHGLPSAGVKLDHAAFARMKRGAVLVNTARGDLIDEDALIAALENGYLSSAGLDVFPQEPIPADSAILRIPNVILTPHIGGSSDEALRRTAVAAARNVIAGLRGSP